MYLLDDFIAVGPQLNDLKMDNDFKIILFVLDCEI